MSREKNTLVPVFQGQVTHLWVVHIEILSYKKQHNYKSVERVLRRQVSIDDM